MGAWSLHVFTRGGRQKSILADGFFVAMVAALAMPMILHATAWEAAAGKFGWMSMTQTGSRSYTGLAGQYSGMVACVWVHGMFGAAMVCIAATAGVRQIPMQYLQQARLEMSDARSWWTVQIPLAASWWIAALVATAALAASEMTVVDLYGVRTLADEFYLFHASNPSMLSILKTLVLPVVLTIALIGVWLIGRRKHVDWQAQRGQPFSSGQQTRGEDEEMLFGEESDRQWARRVAGITLVGCLLLITVIPLASLLVKVGHEVVVYQTTDGTTRADASWSIGACAERLIGAPKDFFQEYRWTLTIASGMSVWALMFAWPMAMIGRRSARVQRVFDIAGIIAFLLPGPIVGLAVVRLFAIDVLGFRTLYQQSLIPTFVALSFRAIPVAYWVMRTGYQGIRNDVLDAGRMDLPWYSRVWAVDRKLLIGSVMTAMLAVGIVSTGDVPATLPVVPPGVSTVGTRLFSLLHSGARYQEAALAVWYVGAVVLIASVISRRNFGEWTNV